MTIFVQADHLMVHVGRDCGRTRFAAKHTSSTPTSSRGERIDVPSFDTIHTDAFSCVRLLQVRRAPCDEVPHPPIAIAQSAGGVRNVASLVRVDCDGIRASKGFELTDGRWAEGLSRHEVAAGLFLGRAADRARPLANHGGKIATPGGVRVDKEAEPLGLELIAHIEDLIERVDAAFFGRSNDTDNGEDGNLLVQTPAGVSISDRGGTL